MNYPLIQFVLAGGSGNGEGFFNILIIVVFAAIWVFRNIFMTQKEQNQRQNKPLTRKPTNKPSLNKDRVEKFLENILQPNKPLQIDKHRHVIQNSQAKKNIHRSSSSKQATSQVQELPSIDPKLQELPEFTDKTPNNLEMSHLTKQKDLTTSYYLSEMFFYKKDPDELKKAILYYEILGKPISLRESSHTIY